MKVGYKYLISTLTGNLLEITCLAETISAYKIHEDEQNCDRWILKSVFEASYKIHTDLGKVESDIKEMAITILISAGVVFIIFLFKYIIEVI